jgi:hypothetical protein
MNLPDSLKLDFEKKFAAAYQIKSDEMKKTISESKNLFDLNEKMLKAMFIHPEWIKSKEFKLLHEAYHRVEIMGCDVALYEVLCATIEVCLIMIQAELDKSEETELFKLYAKEK